MQSRNNVGRVESKLVLYGLLAGIVSGIAQFIVILISFNNINDLLTPISFSITSNAIPSSINWLVKAMTGLSPLLAFIQCMLYGAFFGVLADVLASAGLKAPVAALVSGILYFIVFGIVPFLALLVLGITNKLLITLVLTHPLTYLILFTIFASFKGPWNKVFEKGPKYY